VGRIWPIIMIDVLIGLKTGRMFRAATVIIKKRKLNSREFDIRIKSRPYVHGGRLFMYSFEKGAYT